MIKFVFIPLKFTTFFVPYLRIVICTSFKSWDAERILVPHNKSGHVTYTAEEFKQVLLLRKRPVGPVLM